MRTLASTSSPPKTPTSRHSIVSGPSKTSSPLAKNSRISACRDRGQSGSFRATEISTMESKPINRISPTSVIDYSSHQFTEDDILSVKALDQLQHPLYLRSRSLPQVVQNDNGRKTAVSITSAGPWSKQQIEYLKFEPFELTDDDEAEADDGDNKEQGDEEEDTFEQTCAGSEAQWKSIIAKQELRNTNSSMTEFDSTTLVPLPPPVSLTKATGTSVTPLTRPRSSLRRSRSDSLGLRRSRSGATTASEAARHVIFKETMQVRYFKRTQEEQDVMRNCALSRRAARAKRRLERRLRDAEEFEDAMNDNSDYDFYSPDNGVTHFFDCQNPFQSGSSGPTDGATIDCTRAHAVGSGDDGIVGQHSLNCTRGEGFTPGGGGSHGNSPRFGDVVKDLASLFRNSDLQDETNASASSKEEQDGPWILSALNCGKLQP